MGLLSVPVRVRVRVRVRVSVRVRVRVRAYLGLLSVPRASSETKLLVASRLGALGFGLGLG